MKRYLAATPGVKAGDYPSFEEFDKDRWVVVVVGGGGG